MGNCSVILEMSVKMIGRLNLEHMCITNPSVDMARIIHVSSLTIMASARCSAARSSRSFPVNKKVNIA